MSTSKLESHTMAIEKSNNGLSPPPKILISHGLPVLSGSNPQVVRTPPREYHYPTPPPPPKKKKKKKKEAISDLPPPQKTKQNKNKDPEKKWKKKKKRGNYLCESSLGGPACWRAFIGKRLVRRGLQQQYLMRFSNLVKFMYARNIK